MTDIYLHIVARMADYMYLGEAKGVALCFLTPVEDGGNNRAEDRGRPPVGRHVLPVLSQGTAP